MENNSSSTIQYNHLSLHANCYGTGANTVLAFHGYGQENSVFQPFSRALPNTTVWSFDLPFHGRSHYANSAQPIPVADWVAAIKLFLQQQRISTFSVAAYSMGGKFALSLLEELGPQITRLYLIAPDGIKTSLWYSMSTYPQWARSYFQGLIHKPEPFFKLAHKLHRYKLLDAGIIKFAEWHMNSTAKREKVYNSWTATSSFRFQMKQIAELLVQHRIPLDLFLGQHDKLMTEKGMQRLLRHLPEQQYSLHILPVGHSGLISATAHYLKQHARTNSPR